MEKENFLEKIASNFNHSANVRNVFGDPIQVGGKTIIPVAKIAYGFGGGFEPVQPQNTSSVQNGGPGGGAGGGLYATAKGVYEITSGSTRFIPASPYKHILTGVIIGFIFKTLLKSKR